MSHVNVKGFSTTHLTSFQYMILEIKIHSFFVLIRKVLYTLSQVFEKKDQKFEVQ